MSHPAPYVRSRTVAADALPSAAQSLRRLALASRWAVEASEAVGWAPGTGKPGTESLTSSVVLRGHRGARRFVAVWAGTWRWPDGAILRRSDVFDLDPTPDKVNPWRRFVAVRTYWSPLDPFAPPDTDMPSAPERWTYELGTVWTHPHPAVGTLHPGIGWLHHDGRTGGWLPAADLKTRVKESSE